MNIVKKQIRVNDKLTPYTHFETSSKTVCFMFSGSGYNYDKPLFYYATMLMLENQIDLVHVHYKYEEAIFQNPIEVIGETMIVDVDAVIADVLKNGQYTETAFLGKSLGTIPMSKLLKWEEFSQSTMILLTPLLRLDAIFESILNSQHQALLVIGDKDPHYNVNQMEQLKRSNIKIDIIPNVNHSLDISTFDTISSLSAISRVMGKIHEVLSTKSEA
ncbi:alpha/beta hydrolase [Bacillus sp. AGMB 02131]|uniref:Alpha/beta hydrolase n=1 Tax=Peribacillus faecalis TaxID=2772559 RepID=A0A927HC63_9BACI|nr:alpha/beta hydrolase [Peribacillus faecalis]MBD3109312.1 alpha/beta hydrolase [Peribacillus faecalis]